MKKRIAAVALVVAAVFMPMQTADAEVRYVIVEKPVVREVKVVTEIEKDARIADIEEVKHDMPPERTEETNSIYIEWCDKSITFDDYKLICRTVECEAGNQTKDVKRMVALVILFRLASDIFPNNVNDIIYAPKQFAVTKWNGFEEWEYTEETEEAVFLAIATYPEEPFNMLFFRSGHFHSGYTQYRQVGDMYFSLK